MEEAEVWENLPVEEHKSIWDETERDFWAKYQQQHDQEQGEAEKEFQSACMEAKVEIGNLDGRRTQLTESQARLARELTKVEEELAQVSETFTQKADKLARLERDYRDATQERLETRDKVYKTMSKFFREKRGESSDTEDHEPPRSNYIPSATSSFSNRRQNEGPRVNGTRRLIPDATRPPSADGEMDGIEYQNGTKNVDPKDVLVNVVDADGNVIGPIQRVEPWNQWVQGILELPIQRPVKIRRGRRFNPSHLDGIYERAEAKGVKWLSCMIQAIGEVQSKRCISCEKNQGAFDDCIIVGGDLFQKCGNCEWNRQGCHGSSGETLLSDEPHESSRMSTDIQENTQAPERRETESLPVRELQQNLLPRPEPVVVAKPNQVVEDSATRSHPVNITKQQEQRFSEPSHVQSRSPEVRTPHEAKTNGTQAAQQESYSQRSQAVEYRVTPGFTPANSRSRPPSIERKTPTAVAIEPSPNRSMPSESPAEEPLEEITRENLILKHDGTVYTYPECVAGVPLVKVDENHPYWEPSWQNVRSMIVPQLNRWKEKHQAAIEAGSKPERGGSSKYQIGRQVNRGLKILEFLDEGTISPYQLLGKKFIQSGKGGICSYDTLFRLSETVSELSKFNLDISPVDWMRQRLYEIMQAEGVGFNLPRTVHDFYHDPKLTALRYKHGFKNIGRPSGMKHGRHSLGSNASPRPQQQLKKRKSMHSLSSTPREMSHYEEPMPVQSPIAKNVSVPPDSPFTAHLNKRLKHMSPADSPIHDELFTDEFTDTDSWSDAPLCPRDWRLHQVKSRLFTSSISVTQYWTWAPNEKTFEHQVLKDLKPVQWGFLREPIDFNMKFKDIAEIVWSIDALKVHVIMRPDVLAKSLMDGKPRGDLIAWFKRDSTMRRFLDYCRRLGIKLEKAAA